MSKGSNFRLHLPVLAHPAHIWPGALCANGNKPTCLLIIAFKENIKRRGGHFNIFFL
jgi:hypothetical protein